MYPAAVMIPDYTGEQIPFDNPQSTMMIQMEEAPFQEMIVQQVSFMIQNAEGQKNIIEMMKNLPECIPVSKNLNALKR